MFTCQPTHDKIASCNKCSKDNYLPLDMSRPAGERAQPNGIVLFDLSFPLFHEKSSQRQVLTFCADCLRDLTVAIHPHRSGT